MVRLILPLKFANWSSLLDRSWEFLDCPRASGH